MKLTRTQQAGLLAVLLVILAGMNVYQRYAAEAPQTRPLAFPRGMTMASPVRQGLTAAGPSADPLTLFLARKSERYPGVKRDLFRMSGDGSAQKLKPAVVTKPVATAPPAVAAPVRTPEEIAADVARADLSKFRFLGYLTDKDSSLFLSKDGELFIAKSGDMLLKNYRIKEAGKDHVILLDTVTKVEVRVELSGTGEGRSK